METSLAPRNNLRKRGLFCVEHCWNLLSSTTDYQIPNSITYPFSPSFFLSITSFSLFLSLFLSFPVSFSFLGFCSSKWLRPGVGFLFTQCRFFLLGRLLGALPPPRPPALHPYYLPHQSNFSIYLTWTEHPLSMCTPCTRHWRRSHRKKWTHYNL